MWASAPSGGDGYGGSCEGAKGRGRLSGGREKVAGLRSSRRRVRMTLSEEQVLAASHSCCGHGLDLLIHHPFAYASHPPSLPLRLTSLVPWSQLVHWCGYLQLA